MKAKVNASILETAYWDCAKSNFGQMRASDFKELLSIAHPAFRHLTMQDLEDNLCAEKCGEYRTIRKNGAPSCLAYYYRFPNNKPTRPMFEKLVILINRKKNKNKNIHETTQVVHVPKPETPETPEIQVTQEESTVKNFVEYCKNLGIKKIKLEF